MIARRCRGRATHPGREQGRSGKEVACLEAALTLQREAFGPDDPETVRASHTLAGRYNAFGLRLIMKGPEYQGIAENIFRKALALTRLARDGPVDTKRAALRATTFSNLSCLYRRSVLRRRHRRPRLAR